MVNQPGRAASHASVQRVETVVDQLVEPAPGTLVPAAYLF